MENKRRNSVSHIFMILICLFVIGTLLPIDSFAATEKLYAPSNVHIKRMNKSSVALNWSKVPNASGYQIYKYDKAKKKYALKKTIKGNKKLKWSDTKLKSNTKYTYKVRAYKNSGKKKQYSKFTYSVSCITNTGKSKKVNAAGIDTKTSIIVGLGVPYKVKGEVLVSKKAKKKKKKVIDDKVRLYVPNTGHLKKDKKGRLVGKSLGKTTVYLRAHNGYVKKINVKVVDYAKPSKWGNLSRVDEESRYVLSNFKSELIAIAIYYRNNPPKNVGDLYLNRNNNTIISEGGLKYSAIEDEVYRLLLNTPYYISISVDKEGILFTITDLSSPGADSVYGEIIYDFYEDFTEKGLNNGTVKLAPHWFYNLFVGR